MMVSGSSRAARELLSVVVRTGWVAHTTLSKLLDFGATEKTINQIRLAAPQSNLPSIFSTVGVHHPEKKSRFCAGSFLLISRMLTSALADRRSSHNPDPDHR